MQSHARANWAEESGVDKGNLQDARLSRFSVSIPI